MNARTRTHTTHTHTHTHATQAFLPGSRAELKDAIGTCTKRLPQNRQELRNAVDACAKMVPEKHRKDIKDAMDNCAQLVPKNTQDLRNAVDACAKMVPEKHRKDIKDAMDNCAQLVPKNTQELKEAVGACTKMVPQNRKELKGAVGTYLVNAVSLEAPKTSEGETDDNYPISMNAAAVFISSSCFIGGAAAAQMSTLVLGYLRFTAAGVGRAILAAWWQNLLGKITKGTDLFSILQLLATTSTSNVIHTVGSVFGGAGKLIKNEQTVKYVAGICRRIDHEVSEKTAAGRILEGNTAAVKSGLKLKDTALSTAHNILGCARLWRSSGNS